MTLFFSMANKVSENMRDRSLASLKTELYIFKTEPELGFSLTDKLRRG